MKGADWKRFAAPVAFLLAVTVAVVLVRAELRSPSGVKSTPKTTTRAGAGATLPGKATKRPRPAAKRYYTVVAGDSFGVISTRTGVPVATIERLNPKVSSTTLYVGERVRIR